MLEYTFSRFRQWCCCLSGVALCGLGAALCTRPGLGTSPIAAPPYALTFVSSWSFGTWTVLLNVVFLALQALILGRRFRLRQLVQLLAALVLGVFIDLGMWVTGFWLPEAYWLRFMEFLVGCWVTAAGIAMEIAAGVTYLPGDGFTEAIVRRWKVNFGTVKIVLDGVLVLVAVLVGWLGAGQLHGIREGTVLAVFLVGWFIKSLQRPTRRLRKSLLRRRR